MPKSKFWRDLAISDYSEVLDYTFSQKSELTRSKTTGTLLTLFLEIQIPLPSQLFFRSLSQLLATTLGRGHTGQRLISSSDPQRDNGVST